ncbi:sensor histidine kinase [Actinoplanes regularis]|uniref:sensor histidine kinase n=1 Tax=Actinoplanes regularis TaxID=52697 RepID=UPI0025543F62|nr:HAMP domain-containing sensor histidine kinase [Actinoplanes regularis]GLW27863.1 hypothetical protein Areg01_08030 [Actinoplanes regularis]
MDAGQGYATVNVQRATRQAAALTLAGCLMNLVVIFASPRKSADLTIIIAGLVISALALWLPWHRWHPLTPALLVVPHLAIQSYGTYHGIASAGGGYYVVIMAWLGMNFPVILVYIAGPLVVASYGISLALINEPVAGWWKALTTAVIAIFVGVALAKNVRRELIARQQIAAAERWRAALAATLAHDLRSPLSIIQLSVETVKAETDLPPDLDDLLGRTLRQVERISRLVAGLMDMARIDAQGELRLDLATVPLAEAATEAAAFVGTPVTVQVAPGLTVLADVDRLQQILVNLIANAVRHGRPPIVVHAYEIEEGVCIEVRDHGKGVPSDRRTRLFQRFQSDDGVAESVGLGLWIVDQLARAHGGQAHFRPADPGTVMGVTLPSARGSTADDLAAR